MQPTISLLLPDIRSVHNVGSIFRTADCVGVGHIYLAGVTPTPFDRFGRARKDFAKVSLGAEKTVAWEQVADAVAFIKAQKRNGVKIVALEQSAHSVDYKAVKLEGPALVILGREVEGIAPELLKLADIIAEIPQHGAKESLNVSIAAAVALYRFLNT